MGPNCTPRAVQEQIKKLKKAGKLNGDLPPTPVKYTTPKAKKAAGKKTEPKVPVKIEESDTEDAHITKKARKTPAAKFSTTPEVAKDIDAGFRGDVDTDTPVVKKERKPPATKKAAAAKGKASAKAKKEEGAANKKGSKRKYEEMTEEENVEEAETELEEAETDPEEAETELGDVEPKLEDIDREILGEM